MRRGWLAAVSLLAASPAWAADVIVTVTGVRNDHGRIAVAVCDQSTFPAGACPYHAAVPAHAGQVEVPVPGVPPGTWAAAVFHDELGTGRLEFSLFGTPKQGFGFSRDAPMHYGPPRFADAAFALGMADGAVTVPLHYPPP